MAQIQTLEIVRDKDGATAIAIGVQGIEAPGAIRWGEVPMSEGLAQDGVFLLSLDEAMRLADELDRSIRALTEGGAR